MSVVLYRLSYFTKYLVETAGLEPARPLRQLFYRQQRYQLRATFPLRTGLPVHINLERVAGLEPASMTWKATALPTELYPQKVGEKLGVLPLA